mgnify:CR=1 FL=1
MTPGLSVPSRPTAVVLGEHYSGTSLSLAWRPPHLDGGATVTAYRVGDQKVLNLVNTVKEHLIDFKAFLPEGLNMTIWDDQAHVLRDRLNILIKNGIGGFVLVFVVLALFLLLASCAACRL